MYFCAMTKNSLFTCLIIVFLIAVFSVVILELLVRVVLPAYNPSGMLEFRYNRDGTPLGAKNFTGRQWTNTGDYNVAVRINRYGFRDTKDLRNSKETDIFVVGDSFGFGHGVEEEKRYSNILEGMLDIPVYNISINGTDMDDYEKLIAYAQKNDATLKSVIICIAMENDLRNYRRRDAEGKIKQNATPAKQWEKKHFTVKQWLAKHTALYHVFAHICYENEILRKIAVKAGLIDELIDGRYYAGLEKEPYSQTVVTNSAERLRKLAAPFNATIVIIPSRRLWVGKNQHAERETHERFVALIRENGLNIVDLRPVFEEGGNPLQYHFKHDAHWNEKGHLKAAEELAGNLKGGQ